MAIAQNFVPLYDKNNKFQFLLLLLYVSWYTQPDSRNDISTIHENTRDEDWRENENTLHTHTHKLFILCYLCILLVLLLLLFLKFYTISIVHSTVEWVESSLCYCCVYTLFDKTFILRETTPMKTLQICDLILRARMRWIEKCWVKGRIGWVDYVCVCVPRTVILLFYIFILSVPQPKISVPWLIHSDVNE